MGLLDGAAAAEEGDAEDDASYHHQQDRGVEKRIPKEVQVLAVQPLDHRTSHDQDQTCELKKKWRGYEKLINPDCNQYTVLFMVLSSI